MKSDIALNFIFDLAKKKGVSLEDVKGKTSLRVNPEDEKVLLVLPEDFFTGEEKKEITDLLITLYKGNSIVIKEGNRMTFLDSN